MHTKEYYKYTLLVMVYSAVVQKPATGRSFTTRGFIKPLHREGQSAFCCLLCVLCSVQKDVPCAVGLVVCTDGGVVCSAQYGI